ncbi:O-linked N-acetylglucosamine transferase [Chloropicon primus]|uniref:protein O-GlcNAc transferase n=1 Tax=Chloropicon primus TaxID=1764295 RepID=A0A5B8MZ80_9CHLO|nr:O-linked N-acetylglucosamine transferase [Chloropicon primus]|eukprot:QDZ25366.1 O-linked N-acetylglucosamine transferase [Chloropicon primus]
MTGVESMAGESFSFEDVSEELAFLQKEVAKSRFLSERGKTKQAMRVLQGSPASHLASRVEKEKALVDMEVGGEEDLTLGEAEAEAEEGGEGPDSCPREANVLCRIENLLLRTSRQGSSEEEDAEVREGEGEGPCQPQRASVEDLSRQVRELKGEGLCVYGNLLRRREGAEDRSMSGQNQVDSDERALEAFQEAVEATCGKNTRVLVACGVALRSVQSKIHVAVEMHRAALRIQPQEREHKRELACSLNDLGTYLKNSGTITEDVARVCLDVLDEYLYSRKEDDGVLQEDENSDKGVQKQRKRRSQGKEVDHKYHKSSFQGNGSPLYERIYRAALVVDGEYAASWYNMGVLHGEKNELDKAAEAYLKAIEYCPDYTEALCNYGSLLRSRGDLGGAVKAFERSLRTNPNHAMIRANLAATLCELGAQTKVSPPGVSKPNLENIRKAIAIYEKALSLEPKHPLVLYNLGVAYSEAGEKHKAVAMYELCLCFSPKHAEAWNNLGVVLRDMGNVDRAVTCYKEAVEANPRFGQPLNNLGIVFASKGEVKESLRCFQQAIAASPLYAEVYNNLGVLYRDMGCMEECLTCYRKCLELDPKNRSAGHNLLMGLNYVHCGEEEVVRKAHAEWGLNFAKDFENLLPGFKVVGVGKHGSTGAMEGSSSSECYEISNGKASGGDGVVTSWGSKTTNPAVVVADPDKDLVVGYISPDLFTHSVSYFAEAPITNHRGVKVVVYNVTPTPDAKTDRLKRLSPGNVTWRDVAHLPELEIAKLVREDKVDILVELTGHTANNRLGVMAMKAAPVQATWIGYPNSTGLREVDYRITDWTTDPSPEGPLTNQTYVEALERLPGCFLCYTPTHNSPEVAPLPALQTGAVTFGTFNALAKVTDEVVEAWCAILRRVPSSRLVIKAKPFLCEQGRQRMEQAFSKFGIDPRERVDLIPLVASNQGHLAVYGHVDIALDPWPYAGTTTTTEALYMGVATITLKGRCHAQNVGWTLLQAVGLDADFCAESVEGYVDLAVKWASPENLRALSGIRQNLRERMLSSRLCQAKPFVENLEQVYRKWWKKFCQDRCPSSEENDSDDSGESAHQALISMDH